MDSFNISNWINDSSFLQGMVNSFDVANKAAFHGVILFLMCLLGLPGNMFVITVYIRKLTTSTRVYMFALAIADFAICVGGLVLNAKSIDFVTEMIFVAVINVVITFSVLLLVFVSIERLLAVTRPHSFSLNILRAKMTLAVILVTASVQTMATRLASLMQHKVLYFELCVLFVSVMIMTVCYTVIAVTMLKRQRTLHSQVGVLIVSYTPEPRSSNGSKKAEVNPDVEAAVRPPDPGPSNASTKVNAISVVHGNTHTSTSRNNAATAHVINTSNQTKTYKTISLLFIITIVFVACWLPYALYNVGLSIPAAVRRLFVLNSLLNPFIYGVASATLYLVLVMSEVLKLYNKQTNTKR